MTKKTKLFGITTEKKISVEGIKLEKC